MKKKMIFINQATGYLFIDIVNSFANEYDCVLYAGSIDESNVPLDKNVEVKKFIKYNRNKTFSRILTWGIFSVQAFCSLLFIKKSTTLFIVSNPPFAPFLGYILKKIKGNTYHLLIYDLYPDVLVTFKMIKKDGVINKWWSSYNKKLFQNAETVFTLSNNMAAMIKAYQPIPVDVIANWAHTAFIKPIEKSQNHFAQQYDQVNKITIMYSGNMGATHSVEKIADLANHFLADENFGFMAIGDGNKKPVITEMKNKLRLHNLIILPYQPNQILPFSLACADVGLVTLSTGAEDLSVPSKTYNLLAAGTALLVIASPQSELALLVKKYKCGAQFEETNLKGMILFLNQLKADPAYLQQLKTNARIASGSFTPANAGIYKLRIKNNEHVPQFV